MYQGTLAPPLSLSNDSIDIVFATYWSRPSEIVLQTGKERECNRQWVAAETRRFDNTSPFANMDHQHYIYYGSKLCARKFGESLRLMPEMMFNIHDGQLTIYR
ncbi:unnamed protein product [Protopolystoma xenopodis]|uniref:Uncharacterized protein n=1 Tax=Protopolystoma xenopodis TaxID=117903 RepID=A0A3S5CJC5_9PLAT|nr:unnamed protein product [Protopolystoma xenopodis]